MKKLILPIVAIIIYIFTLISPVPTPEANDNIATSNYIGFYNGRSVENPNIYGIGYATSSDGVHWSKGQFEIIKPRQEMFDKSLNGPCPVQVGEYIYVYYTGYNREKFSTGVAIFNQNFKMVYRAKNPVLDTGSLGSWDSRNIFRVSILYEPNAIDTNKKFLMYYGGQGDEGYQIGLAYSPDGIKWTKYENNPILAYGNAGEFDSSWASQPTVSKINGVYYMGYTGYNDVKMQGGFAVSSAPEGPWIKLSNNPILKNKPSAVQNLLTDALPGSTVLHVADSSVFAENEACYLQNAKRTELVRVKSKLSPTTVELYEAVKQIYTIADKSRLISIFADSVGSNQIEYADGKYKIYASTWANIYGYETTACAEGKELTAVDWVYEQSPLIDFNPINTDEWDSMSQENMRFIKLNTSLKN